MSCMILALGPRSLALYATLCAIDSIKQFFYRFSILLLVSNNSHSRYALCACYAPSWNHLRNETEGLVYLRYYDEVWNFYGVLNYLQALVEKSTIILLLEEKKKRRDGDSGHYLVEILWWSSFPNWMKLQNTRLLFVLKRTISKFSSITNEIELYNIYLANIL